MELEIGMYVRTINGKIWIIISQKAISGHRKDIKKASYNIIDLIEEHDLIKYRIHGDLYISEVQGHPEFDRYKLHIEYSDTIINLEDLEIVSVLTHEQFSQMEYKL